jgi:hypothetical protein
VLVVSLITLVVLGALGGLTAGAILYLRTEGGLTGLLTKMAEVIENSRELLPPWAGEWLPQGDESVIRSGLVEWLRSHAQDLRKLGGDAGRVLVLILVGFIIGSFIALRKAAASQSGAPGAGALRTRQPPGRRLPPRGVRAGAHLRAERLAHLGLPRPHPARAGVELPFVKTMVHRHLCRRPAAGAGQPGFQYHHRHHFAVALALCRRGLARVPGGDPQARIFRERTYHWHPDQGARVGAADRHAVDGSRFRHTRRDRRAGFLCVYQKELSDQGLI